MTIYLPVRDILSNQEEIAYSNLLCPFYWDPHVPENRSTKLVTGLISENRRILSVGEARKLVGASEYHFNVALEVIDDSLVGVELHDLGVGGVRSGQVEPSPTEESVFASMVVILDMDTIRKCRTLRNRV